MKKIFSCFLLFLILCFSSNAQDVSIFKKSSKLSLKKTTAGLTKKGIQIFSLDQGQLEYFFSNHKLQSNSSVENQMTIVFPNELGQPEKFSIREVALLSGDLSKKHPNIRTFVGTSLTRKQVTVRWSSSPLGVDAMINSPAGSYFIQPSRKGDQGEHFFYKREEGLYDDYDRLNCLVTPKSTFQKIKGQLVTQSSQTNKTTSARVLKTYRIAVSATGEFTQFWGDNDLSNGSDKEDAFAKIVSTINRINQIFEVDLGVQLQLISDVNLIYDSPSADPYGSNFNSEIQEVLTDSIGEANYDIGHLFDYGNADGSAGTIGNVCVDGRKGSAYTSHPFVDITDASAEFLNDYFDIDFVAHEIGHQFGAYHTYSHQVESQQVNSEPGSGSTIMAYAGVTANDNVQNHSDTYFHYHSIKNINDYLDRNSCQISIDSGNLAPTVSAGLDVSIPKGTAYTLEAVGTDPSNDDLTYCWEQLNSGFVSRSNFGPYLQSGSSNRSFSPTNSHIRTIPSMTRVLNGKLTQMNPQLSSDWETVSLVGRTLNWGVTVRDRSISSSPSIGQTAQDSRVVSIIESAGPFELISQATNTIIWETGANQVISWNVANTDKAPINTETVSIYLSSDNGLNFDTLLVSNTLNNGRYDFIVPEISNTSNARIKIVPNNGIYFAVNSQPFHIRERPFATPFEQISKKSCNQATVVFDFTLNQYQDFSDSVSFTLTNVPEGINFSITPSSILTNREQGRVSLTNLSNLMPGPYTLTLVSSSGSLQTQQNFEYIHRRSTIESPSGLTPILSDGVQSLKPDFNWVDNPNVDHYIVELSTSNTFDVLTVSSTSTTSNFTPLENFESNTRYYWRVKSVNVCGVSDYSEIQSFDTSLIDCEAIGASNLPITLQDANSTTSGITYADVYMANDFTIYDLNVEISIRHTYLSDLILSLIAPDGTEVSLARNIGGTRDNFLNTIFDQEATNTTDGNQAPFTGSFIPEGDLSVFYGQSSFGVWKLKVEDIGPIDSGRIVLFNIDFCVNGVILLDEDYDLIPDPSDNCPLISNQNQNDSDADGLGDLCDVDTFNNFTVSKFDETCISRNNGSIQVRATAVANYSVQVTGPNGFANGYTFSTNDLNIPNLESGDYLICIGVSEDPEFERCFAASIEEPAPLQVTSLVNESDLSLSLSLSGAQNYNVTVNSLKTKIQSESQVNLPLRKGLNVIEISTDLSCQGTFKKEIYIATSSVLYPNPVQEEAYVLIGGTASVVQYILYDIQGNIILDETIQLEALDRKVPINVNQLSRGNYFLKIISKKKQETIRFIKQ